MGKETIFCIISGCTPEVAGNLKCLTHFYGPVVTSALESLTDQNELRSQNDLCIIAPVDLSGQLLYPEEDDLGEPILSLDIEAETDVRVVPHCIMGRSWDLGVVDAPPPNKEKRNYSVSFGLSLMVHTYALDIMALATHGRMTPLRLWRLAMSQGFDDMGHFGCLEDVNYGEIECEWEPNPSPFPGYFCATPSGLEYPDLFELEELEDVETVKQQIVHEGKFWLWMAPDRFPVSPTEHDCAMFLPEVDLSAGHSTVESLPPEVLMHVVSFLPISSVFDFASTSRSARTKIFGNDYLARVWIHNNALWWIPVPTRTPKLDGPRAADPRTHPASEHGAQVQLTTSFPTGLDWGYVGRCLRSGSMRNRVRIWNAALDIERTAEVAGV